MTAVRTSCRRVAPSSRSTPTCQAWRKARTDAGCSGRIPHDFRATAVHNLVRAGVPERVTCPHGLQ